MLEESAVTNQEAYPKLLGYHLGALWGRREGNPQVIEFVSEVLANRSDRAYLIQRGLLQFMANSAGRKSSVTEDIWKNHFLPLFELASKHENLGESHLAYVDLLRWLPLLPASIPLSTAVPIFNKACHSLSIENYDHHRVGRAITNLVKRALDLPQDRHYAGLLVLALLEKLTLLRKKKRIVIPAWDLDDIPALAEDLEREEVQGEEPLTGVERLSARIRFVLSQLQGESSSLL